MSLFFPVRSTHWKNFSNSQIILIIFHKATQIEEEKSVCCKVGLGTLLLQIKYTKYVL